jgi:hypothetical protein
MSHCNIKEFTSDFFIQSSKQWRLNKVHLGKGIFRYGCEYRQWNTDYNDFSYCLERLDTTFSKYCEFHRQQRKYIGLDI